MLTASFSSCAKYEACTGYIQVRMGIRAFHTLKGVRGRLLRVCMLEVVAASMPYASASKWRHKSVRETIVLGSGRVTRMFPAMW